MRFTDVGTVVRSARSSALDAPLPSGAEADRITVYGIFAPGSSSEDTLQRGATVRTTAIYYAAPGSDIRRTDRLELEGRVWEVDGDPLPWRSPRSRRTAGLQVNLRSTRG